MESLCPAQNSIPPLLVEWFCFEFFCSSCWFVYALDRCQSTSVVGILRCSISSKTAVDRFGYLEEVVASLLVTSVKKRFYFQCEQKKIDNEEI